MLMRLSEALAGPTNGTLVEATKPSGWFTDVVRSAEGHDLILAILIIIFVGAYIGGPMFKALVRGAVKFFGSHEPQITINTPGGKVSKDKSAAQYCEGCDQMIDPTKCVMHQAEHERSLQNQKAIEQLWQSTSKIRDEMNLGFKEIRQTVITGQSAILEALGKRPPWMNVASQWKEDK